MEIFSVEAKDFFSLQILKDIFKLTAHELCTEVLSQLSILEHKLNQSELSYNEFKSVLLPIKNSKKKDYIFVFDTTKIDNYSYGYEIFEKILPCFSKETKHNVLSGDLLNLTEEKNISPILEMMFKALNKPMINEPKYTNRFYLVYITNISQNDLSGIIDNICDEVSYVGSCDMTHTSLFKSYIANCIRTTFIKLGSTIVMGHESDIEENSDVNMYGYPFLENGYKIVSIQGDYFYQFLSYSIDSDIILDTRKHRSYISILSNIIMKAESELDKSSLEITVSKLEYLEKYKTVLSRLKISPEYLNEIVLEKIRTSNIYNISFEHEDKGVIKFNIYFDYLSGDKFKKMLCALGYDMNTKKLHLITMY